MSCWKSVLELDSNQTVIGGSEKALCEAIGNAADLRIYTGFIHNEHIDVTSDISDLVEEVSEFRVTYLMEKRWSAGIMSLRQPIKLPEGFGAGSSMSFFMYNQDGSQAIARPYLDDSQKNIRPDASQLDEPCEKYRVLDSCDDGTNAPSSNFIYDFELFKYCVQDNWQEMFAHDADGNVVSGSLDTLMDAFAKGCEIKVGIRGLCDDLAEDGKTAIDHEVFIQTGWGYYYTQSKYFIVETQPVVRVRPGIPIVYKSKGWDFGWIMLRTDGFAVQRICDPYTLKFTDTKRRLAVRWFAR